MQDLRPSLCAGQPVHARGERWHIASTEIFDGCAIVTLSGADAANAGDTTRLIAPFDRIRPLAERRRLIAAPRREVMRAAAQAVTACAPWGACWSSVKARIDLREWQMQPARAVLQGTTRVLLADDVGLGKTIQAALIVSELVARRLAQRVLVLTPASLRDQWAHELSTRFGLMATVFDHASLATLVHTLPAGVNPWSTSCVIVSSIDLVKRPEVRSAVDSTTLDLLVVDEAHHLTPGSDRAALVADLARRVPWVVLVTATPHSGDADAFATLAGIGDVAGRGDLRIFRRQAGDVEVPIRRRVRVAGVAPTGEERALLEGTLGYARALWRISSHAAGAGLVGSIIARRAASCAESALRTLRRRRALIAGEAPEREQPLLPWEDEHDGADAPEADAILAAPGVGDRPAELAQLDALIALAARAAGRSSKVECIRRVLRRTRESALVFSEYRDTAEWVASRLEETAPVAVLHGGMSPGERRASAHAFTSGHVRTLVATDAAGEGLNLQARCRLVINLELPWNPQRLEQRIGRLARIGQTRQVHALHLVHRGSFEDEVLARVERRRERARQTLGASDRSMTEAPAWETAARRLRQAIVHQRFPTRAGRACLSADTPSGEPPQAVVAVGQCDLLDRTGAIVRRALVPIAVALAGVGSSTRVEKNVVFRVATDPVVRGRMQAEAEERARRLRAEIEPFTTLTGRRFRDLIRAVDDTSRVVPLQASLFDRRHEQALHARDATRRRWAEHLARRRSRVDAISGITAGPLQIVAVWAAE